jgi:2,3-bisphosphoglycerate-dependent phosphoglycerate mutase
MKLIIARHGNTFGPGDTIRRVGARTDLPLVESGRKQAEALGRTLQQCSPTLSSITCGSLTRLQETAALICSQFGNSLTPSIDPRFNELDYGEHDGMPEDEFLQAITTEALKEWNERAIPLPEWKINREELIDHWKNFSNEMKRGLYGDTALIVTSNGMARFAPYLTEDFEAFRKTHPLKLSTGAYGVFTYSEDHQHWHIEEWNVRPRG